MLWPTPRGGEAELAGNPADVDPAFLACERIERGDRVVPVQAEVTREMVARPKGDADEGQVALDRDFRDRRQRAVAARHAERVGLSRSCELRGVVLLLEDSGFDPAVGGGRAKLVRARGVVPRARIDE